MRILQHITDLAVQPQLRPLPVIHAVDQYPSLCGFEEPAHQIHKGGLPGPRLTDNGNIHPGWHMEVKMLQYIFLPVRIPKGNVLKHDIPPYLFPIIPIRHKGVAVFLKHMGLVYHIRLLFQQIRHPLDIRLTGNQVRQQSGQLLDRFEYNHRIGDKNR